LEVALKDEFEKVQKEEGFKVEVDSNNLPLSPIQFVEY